MLSTLLLQALSLLLCAEQLSFARIIPRPNKPIELDITNQNMIGDYRFHFFLEQDTLPGNRQPDQTSTSRLSSPRAPASASPRPATRSSCPRTSRI
jgi:hypothetical protein